MHGRFQSLTDAVIGFVESNGRSFIMDMWTTGYLQPILESSQDLTNMEGIIEDGFTTLKFTRLRNTGDAQDVAFTDDKRKNSFLDFWSALNCPKVFLGEEFVSRC